MTCKADCAFKLRNGLYAISTSITRMRAKGVVAM